MRLVCARLDDEFLQKARRYNLRSGSTLLFSIINNGHLTIANLGDSCGYLMKKCGRMNKVTVD